MRGEEDGQVVDVSLYVNMKSLHAGIIAESNGTTGERPQVHGQFPDI